MKGLEITSVWRELEMIRFVVKSEEERCIAQGAWNLVRIREIFKIEYRLDRGRHFIHCPSTNCQF